MAGILNKKERVMDVLITEFGRDAMSKGTFNPVFYSFGDSGTDYRTDDGTAIAEDFSIASIEAYSTDKDIVIAEIEDTNIYGLTKEVSEDLYLVNGEIVSGSAAAGVSVTLNNYNINDYDIGSIKDNFGSKLILRDSGSSTFTIQPESLKANIDKSQLIDNIAQIPSLSADIRVSNSIKIRTLPPVALNNGAFQEITQNTFSLPVRSEKDILHDISISSLAKLDIELKGDKLDLIGHVLVQRDNKIEKLAIIKVDEFTDQNGLPSSKVYHCGRISKNKVLNSDVTITTLARSFSIVFHNGDK